MNKVFSSKHGLLGAIAFWAMAPHGAQAVALQLEDSRSREYLACVELQDDKFTLSFIHSVSLTPVEDLYELKKNSPENYLIKQVEERFMTHGYGLPSTNGAPDVQRFEQRNKGFTLYLDRPIETLIVRLDRRFKNRLSTGTKKINLNQWPDFSGVLFTPIDRCH